MQEAPAGGGCGYPLIIRVELVGWACIYEVSARVTTQEALSKTSGRRTLGHAFPARGDALGKIQGSGNNAPLIRAGRYCVQTLYHNSVAVVELVLDNLGGKVAEFLPLRLEVSVLVSHSNLPGTLCWPFSSQ